MMFNNYSRGEPRFGIEEATEKWDRKEEQGEDYNQPRQEHTNDGMAVGEED
jgi:hypothetical protein